MGVTTVKVDTNTKLALDAFREHNETYDQIIRKLIVSVRDKSLKKRLEEAYRSMGKEDIAFLEEWETASSELF